MSDGEPHISFEELYNSLKFDMESKGFTCEVFGDAGIICRPCPLHPNEKFDGVYMDLSISPHWHCIKDTVAGTENIPNLPVSIDTLKDAKKHSKPNAQKRNDFRAVLLASKYAIANYVISVKNEDKYAVFVYRPHLGKYVLIGKEIIRGELQQFHRDLFEGEHPTETIARLAFYDLAEWTERKEGIKVFDHDTGATYVLPFRDKDVLINRATSEMKVLDKDPLGRPVNTALPYDYSILNEASGDMPKELEDLLSLVPPSHYKEFLFELVSPLAMQGMRRIYVNFSRVGSTGKTTVLRRIQELYEDLVAWTNVNALGERFENSLFLGKSAILLDEYEGAGLRQRREFKTLASNNSLRVEVKNGPILNVRNRLVVIVNTNVLRFAGADDALLSRLIIIPFVRNFDSTTVVEEWSKETKARIISWLTRNILPRYFREEPKKYSIYKIKDWSNKAENGEPPEDGLEDFLHSYFYKTEVNMGVAMTLEQAFRYYLLFTAQVNLIPLTFQEFVDKLEIISMRDGAWLFEEGGEKKLCMKKSGLAFFM
ncbi:hypothetical protein SMF1_0013 [Sulfolobales Mexican fusellovirus 1]|uniref:hypothetical protein n=1 Tax=Sulfolobales Mexican fusellovirus 1 TaxID=1298531 RepID=UPI0002C10E26|nr:hypothetical protein SMF1_0013 [Sulfolobales Mexican fusellovirus 1]AGG36560.1 hypothetical protein SMF1_0013 [Sulfolobales Mexican fusellovirus 1]